MIEADRIRADLQAPDSNIRFFQAASRFAIRRLNQLPRFGMLRLNQLPRFGVRHSHQALRLGLSGFRYMPDSRYGRFGCLLGIKEALEVEIDLVQHPRVIHPRDRVDLCCAA
ncbi:hypothetical protein [Roseomonas chloroacetimidivorans]|uniref:hypothetical protein n=1 Tax=Roseomonas chloroacetimidivorans TaxID=1766656 RepID=UPI003C7826D0